MSGCIGWLFDISIEHDQAILWIKTVDRQILKLRDSYHPSFYILARSESDGLYLFQILSQQQDIVKKVSWEAYVSSVLRTDELYLKVKDNMKYLYALMDDETRFWRYGTKRKHCSYYYRYLQCSA